MAVPRERMRSLTFERGSFETQLDFQGNSSRALRSTGRLFSLPSSALLPISEAMNGNDFDFRGTISYRRFFLGFFFLESREELPPFSGGRRPRLPERMIENGVGLALISRGLEAMCRNDGDVQR